MTPNQNERDHLPVMAGEVAKFLITDSAGAYLDLTVGLGGHLLALAEALSVKARLYGVDKDAAAIALADQRLEKVPQFRSAVIASYGDIDKVVTRFEDKEFDGVLLDLGLSSLQLDEPERGFAFRHEGPLDMRFDPGSTRPTAADLINALDERELARIIRSYGEERKAARLAEAIVTERRSKMILTTHDLARIVRETISGPHQVKSLARVFQALRIAVNEELATLSESLPRILAHVKDGGRIVVIAYHSLEDRIVKDFFREKAKGCICPREFPVCTCGRVPQLRLITRRVVKPDAEELNRNPRARSARLRVVEKLAI